MRPRLLTLGCLLLAGCGADAQPDGVVRRSTDGGSSWHVRATR